MGPLLESSDICCSFLELVYTYFLYIDLLIYKIFQNFYKIL